MRHTYSHIDLDERRKIARWSRYAWPLPSTDLVLIGNHWQTAFVRKTGFGLPGGRDKAALCADRVPLLVDQNADEDHATHDSEIQRRRDTK